MIMNCEIATLANIVIKQMTKLIKRDLNLDEDRDEFLNFVLFQSKCLSNFADALTAIAKIEQESREKDRRKENAFVPFSELDVTEVE